MLNKIYRRNFKIYQTKKKSKDIMLRKWKNEKKEEKKEK